MTASIPESVAAEGNVNVYFLPAGVNLAALTVAEFTAGVDITCFLPEVWDGITGEQSKGEQTRMCLKESFEVLGKIKRSISDLTYTYLPQEDGTDPANKVKTMLATGSNGVVVVRYGLPAPTAIAAAQKYDAIRSTTGVQNKNTKGSDEFAPLTITQSISAQGALTEGAVAA